MGCELGFSPGKGKAGGLSAGFSAIPQAPAGASFVPGLGCTEGGQSELMDAPSFPEAPGVERETAARGQDHTQ